MVGITRKRVDENAVITVITEDGKNPKREGSLAYDRFELYQDGMTVREAKAAGLLAVDIVYDMNHGYIKLDPGTATAANEDEEKPKKKRKAKKAA
jgi:hypothetical protein